MSPHGLYPYLRSTRTPDFAPRPPRMLTFMPTTVLVGAIALASQLTLTLGACRIPTEQAFAQEPHHDPYFTPTGVESSTYMPSVIIRNMREDRPGNIWFSTFGGPIPYDGKSFTNSLEEVGLSGTRVFSLLGDRSGALWFGCTTPRAKAEPTERSTLERHSQPHGLLYGSPASFCEARMLVSVIYTHE